MPALARRSFVFHQWAPDPARPPLKRSLENKMRPTIETNNLVKQYGPVTAVTGLTLRVERGEIYAFLGLNGAGKTTTIRLLLGMVKPTSGDARILGHIIGPGAQDLWADVGYLVESADAYPELTVRENLEIMRRLRPGTRPEAVDAVIERLGLAAYARRRAGTLSSGNAQRLGVAKALMHEPQILILDEPAKGLDPAGIVEMRHLFLNLAREQGVTIFMSSHFLDEVSRMAQRIGIIHEGRLVQELAAAELDRVRRQRLLLRTRDQQATCALLQSAGYTAGMNGDGAIAISDRNAIERPDELATYLVNAGQPPTMLLTEQEDLEAYFLRLVGMEETK